MGSAHLKEAERSAIARLNAGEFVVEKGISRLAVCRLVTVARLASSVVSLDRLRRFFFGSDIALGTCSAPDIMESLKRDAAS